MILPLTEDGDATRVYYRIALQIVTTIVVVGASRWYKYRAGRQGKIIGNLIVIAACTALMVVYLGSFSELTFPPPSNWDYVWLVLIVAFPAILITWSAFELRRILRQEGARQ
ncbi:MAG: hypothetical protein ABJB74_09730 [Gemmatimonas sp.]